MNVLVDRIDGECAFGRSVADAPEIDGIVQFDLEPGLPVPSVGGFARVAIEASDTHDLFGRQDG
jgi:ribosomal protein S12 methylthiotransferase